MMRISLLRCGIAMFAAAVMTIGATGCAEHRVIYKPVPRYMIEDGIVPPRFTLDDGTVVVHVPSDGGAAGSQDAGLPGAGGSAPGNTDGWHEDEDGNVTIRAMLPEQLIAIFMRCLATERYDVLYEQVYSRTTREAFEAEGSTFEEFVDYTRRNRNEMYAALNRMRYSMYGQAVVREVGPMNGIRIRFHHHYADDFEFTTLDIVRELDGLKVLIFRPKPPRGG